MSRIRPAWAPTLAALCTAVLVAGCSAGHDAQRQQHAPADGVLADSGDIRIQDALVVSAEGSNRGVLSMTVVNRGDRDDQITAITSTSGRVDLTGATDLPAGGLVTFGAGTDPSATVEALSRQPGQSIQLVVRFARTQPITMRTVVVTPTGAYASVTPGPEAPEETETPTPSPTGSAGVGSTASPSPTAG